MTIHLKPHMKDDLPEEHIEYSNVTDLRQSLLPVVEKLQTAPAVRYIITKHGRPQAVLMSFQTYDLLKRILNQTREKADTTEAGGIARLRAERRPEFGSLSAGAKPKAGEDYTVVEGKVDAKEVLEDAMRTLREIEQKFKVNLRRLDKEAGPTLAE